jgi:K+-transporting ATPase ATPase A chain
MLVGRYWVIVPDARDRRLAREEEEASPSSPGTLPTHTPLFVVLLVGTVVLVGALTFIPALALGPVVEHLQLMTVAP